MSSQIKISDAIADYLKQRQIRHVFGIIGSANSHIFDSIQKLGFTEIICVHHEQAATMAMQSYFRVKGEITAALVTAGGGSSNAITGVLSAWADSLPGVVISGQENTRFIKQMDTMRMWGIQGYDSTDMVRKITKYQSRIFDPSMAVHELEKAFHIAGTGRPGPVWVDYPMDMQGAQIASEELSHFTIPEHTMHRPKPKVEKMDKLENLLRNSKRPVFWLGHGIRLAGAHEMIEPLLDVCPIPSLVSWAGLDLLAENQTLNFGQAGVYGTRAGNFILQNSDLVVTIGNRMAIPMIGYDHSEFAREAKVVQVDIDPTEFEKVKDITHLPIIADANEFLQDLLHRFNASPLDASNTDDWVKKCIGYKIKYPRVGPEHEDTKGFMNSYKFIEKLSEYFIDNQIITTDTGTALLSGHESIKLRRGQRLMTSTGLGEMGCGLPAAIGASFATGKGKVLSLNCDGGMMMNLQELQTIVHHKLPIKIFIFNNDGYLMIKHTQKNLFNGTYSAVNANTGVSCPDYGKIAAGFGVQYFSMKTWDDFDWSIRNVMDAKCPVICEVFMDPEQFFYPKLTPTIDKNGKITSPPLEDLSPMIPRDELEQNMLVGIHEKSTRFSPSISDKAKVDGFIDADIKKTVKIFEGV